MYPRYKKSKYGAKKTVIDGIEFQSKKEGHRYQELLWLQKTGAISDLKRQVKYVLIPAQREPDRVGVRGGKIQGRLIEREVAYIADFVYYDKDLGHEVIEDVKGCKSGNAYTIFTLKRKMMLYFYGIRIKEV